MQSLTEFYLERLGGYEPGSRGAGDPFTNKIFEVMCMLHGRMGAEMLGIRMGEEPNDIKSALDSSSIFRSYANLTATDIMRGRDRAAQLLDYESIYIISDAIVKAELSSQERRQFIIMYDRSAGYVSAIAKHAESIFGRYSELTTLFGLSEHPVVDVFVNVVGAEAPLSGMAADESWSAVSFAYGYHRTGYGQAMIQQAMGNKLSRRPSVSDKQISQFVEKNVRTSDEAWPNDIADSLALLHTTAQELNQNLSARSFDAYSVAYDILTDDNIITASVAGNVARLAVQFPISDVLPPDSVDAASLINAYDRAAKSHRGSMLGEFRQVAGDPFKLELVLEFTQYAKLA